MELKSNGLWDPIYDARVIEMDLSNEKCMFTTTKKLLLMLRITDNYLPFSWIVSF